MNKNQTIPNNSKTKKNKIKGKSNNRIWFGLIIILLGFIFASQIPYFKVEDNHVGLVLGFIGVMACFIVINNYAQVIEIEQKFENKIDEIRAEVESSKNTMYETIKESFIKKMINDVGGDKYKLVHTIYTSTTSIYCFLVRDEYYDKDEFQSFANLLNSIIDSEYTIIKFIDDVSIIPLIVKYPLSRDEYIKYADHVIADTDSISKTVSQKYVYKDWQYEKYKEEEKATQKTSY